MSEAPRITLELFGVPRLRAGVARVPLVAGSVAEALDELGRVCPGLVDSVLFEGRLHPAYLLNLNGERFLTSDQDVGAVSLRDGDSLLLMAADVGG